MRSLTQWQQSGAKIELTRETMKKEMRTQTQTTIAGLLLLTASTAALAQWEWADESVTLSMPSEDDVYLAGRLVEVLAPVAGDAVLAGQSVIVAGRVAGDVIAAGETVSIRAQVGDDVRAAGRDVSLQGDIGGHLAAAGHTVTIDPAVTIGDWAWLAGEYLVVRGTIGQELKAAGSTIRIAGNVGGNADLAGGRIHIESGAVIDGDLTVHSEHAPEIDEGARIGGEVVHRPSLSTSSDADEWGISGQLFFGIAVLLALLVFYWLFPRFAQRTATTSVTSPLKSLGLGIVAIAVTPLVIIVLLATGVGFLLALPLGAAYLILLLLGYLAGLHALADFVAHRTGHDVASRGARSLILALTVLAIALIALIPMLGPLAIFLVWLTGTGALVLVLQQKYTEPAGQST